MKRKILGQVAVGVELLNSEGPILVAVPFERGARGRSFLLDWRELDHFVVLSSVELRLFLRGELELQVGGRKVNWLHYSNGCRASEETLSALLGEKLN